MFRISNKLTSNLIIYLLCLVPLIAHADQKKEEDRSLFIPTEEQPLLLQGKIEGERYYSPQNVFSCQADDYGQGYFIGHDALLPQAACVALYSEKGAFKKAEIMFWPGVEKCKEQNMILKTTFEGFGIHTIKDVDFGEGIKIIQEEMLSDNVFFGAVSIDNLPYMNPFGDFQIRYSRGYLVYPVKDKLVVLSNQILTLPDQPHEPEKKIDRLKSELLAFKETFQFGPNPKIEKAVKKEDTPQKLDLTTTKNPKSPSEGKTPKEVKGLFENFAMGLKKADQYLTVKFPKTFKCLSSEQFTSDEGFGKMKGFSSSYKNVLKTSKGEAVEYVDYIYYFNPAPYYKKEKSRLMRMSYPVAYTSKKMIERGQEIEILQVCNPTIEEQKEAGFDMPETDDSFHEIKIIASIKGVLNIGYEIIYPKGLPTEEIEQLKNRKHAYLDGYQIVHKDEIKAGGGLICVDSRQPLELAAMLCRQTKDPIVVLGHHE